jgi:3D (Asp-Asp-Asp) domain-containing protein
MIVPGYNNSRPVEVLDRGGAIRGNRLDVFFDSHWEARQWGVKHLPVKVRAD